MPMKGSELRRIRTKMGLTQKQFAEKVSVTQNTVARWERDEVRITEPMVKLIKILGRTK
jgi:putative transcriptional regulator